MGEKRKTAEKSLLPASLRGSQAGDGSNTVLFPL